jgi:DNA-directed RNA polymerase subunit RPC12/RpoP
MSIAGQVAQVAAALAQNAQGRMSRLQHELKEIETRKTEIEAQLKVIGLIPERVLNFKPRVGADFQCPRCWIEHENRSALIPMGGGTSSEDYFRCPDCSYEIAIPFR